MDVYFDADEMAGGDWGFLICFVDLFFVCLFCVYV